MIKQLKIVLLALSFALIQTSTAFGSDNKDASISVFVFFKGDPLYLIDIVENDKIIGTTDNFGSTKIQLKPGSHTWTFKSEEDEIYQHTLEVSAREIIQLLVDIKEKEPVNVSMESSKQSDNQADTTFAQSTDESSGIMTKLSGQIISAENQKPIANARIYISGISGNLFTDDKGLFSTELLSGKYNLSVLHAKFNSTLKPNIEISEGGLTDLVIELTPSGTELPEFVVIAPFIEGSLASVLEEKTKQLGCQLPEYGTNLQVR